MVFVRTRVSGTPSAQRLTVDLAVACAAAASWLLVSAASIDWLPSVLLTVMVVVLIDAALIAARPAAADVDARITLLVAHHDGHLRSVGQRRGFSHLGRRSGPISR